jgi:glycosyltransferase involved in cell wall biosynthesis
VVIPAWDSYAGAPLRAALASVRGQPEVAETIVVDNASAPAVAPLEGVTVVRIDDRRSTGAARNRGLELVRTPLVLFLDADDTLIAGAVGLLVAGLAAHPGAAAFVMSIVDGTTGRRHRTPRRLARALARRPRAFALTNAVWSLVPTQGCAIMRADAVRAAGGFADSDHGEDWVLATSLAFRGRVVFDPRPALVYRLREDSPGEGPMPTDVLLANARRVRDRLRADAAVPAWARVLLPAIALGQWAAVFLLRPLIRAARAVPRRW